MVRTCGVARGQPHETLLRSLQGSHSLPPPLLLPLPLGPAGHLCPQLQEGHLLVRHFQFLRWSAYRDTPDSKKAFLHLLAEVDKWQAESGDGRTVVHCL